MRDALLEASIQEMMRGRWGAYSRPDSESTVVLHSESTCLRNGEDGSRGVQSKSTLHLGMIEVDWVDE